MFPSGSSASASSDSSRWSSWMKDSLNTIKQGATEFGNTVVETTEEVKGKVGDFWEEDKNFSQFSNFAKEVSTKASNTVKDGYTKMVQLPTAILPIISPQPNTGVYIVVLGVSSEAGYPAFGCSKSCCKGGPSISVLSRIPVVPLSPSSTSTPPPTTSTPTSAATPSSPPISTSTTPHVSGGLAIPSFPFGSFQKRRITCIALVDENTRERWIFGCTPDFPEQLRLLDEIAPVTRKSEPIFPIPFTSFGSSSPRSTTSAQPATPSSAPTPVSPSSPTSTSSPSSSISFSFPSFSSQPSTTAPTPSSNNSSTSSTPLSLLSAAFAPLSLTPSSSTSQSTSTTPPPSGSSSPKSSEANSLTSSGSSIPAPSSEPSYWPKIFIPNPLIGQYSGLLNFSREHANLIDNPQTVYCMPQMAKFLQSHGPWKELVRDGNIALKPLSADRVITLNASGTVTVMPFLLPHTRNSYGEYVGFRIEGPSKKTVIYIPSTSHWEKWKIKILDVVRACDVVAVLIDGTTYCADDSIFLQPNSSLSSSIPSTSFTQSPNPQTNSSGLSSPTNSSSSLSSPTAFTATPTPTGTAASPSLVRAAPDPTNGSSSNSRLIDHPTICETVLALSTLAAADKQKVKFLHLEHTNPCLWSSMSALRREVRELGFEFAEEKQKIYI